MPQRGGGGGGKGVSGAGKKGGVRLSNSNKERRRLREGEKTDLLSQWGGKNGEDRNRQKVKRWKEMELFEEKDAREGLQHQGLGPHHQETQVNRRAREGSSFQLVVDPRYHPEMHRLLAWAGWC